MTLPRIEQLEQFECFECFGGKCLLKGWREEIFGDTPFKGGIQRFENTIAHIRRCSEWSHDRNICISPILELSKGRREELLHKASRKGKKEAHTRSLLIDNISRIHGIPLVFIGVEVPIRVGTTKVFADVVIYSDIQRTVPLAVIEVKTDETLIREKALAQAQSYASLLGIDRFFCATEYIMDFSKSEFLLHYTLNKKWELRTTGYFRGSMVSWTQSELSRGEK